MQRASIVAQTEPTHPHTQATHSGPVAQTGQGKEGPQGWLTGRKHHVTFPLQEGADPLDPAADVAAGHTAKGAAKFSEELSFSTLISALLSPGIASHGSWKPLAC